MAEEKKTNNKWLVPVIAIVVVVVLAVAGVFVWRAMSGGSVESAKAACMEASDATRVATNKYNGLVNGDASTASEYTEEDVTDASTLDALNEALAAETPTYVSCAADDAAGYEAVTETLNEATAWYESHLDSLQEAIDAVNASLK
ncbi:hypothetical protein [Bifidobacterium eulemuris]|uniref:Colicin transporter n=1 Tax=Bifidobacterium eulemuris TaxID=1765219 RepID=A0A261G3I7_9BIFI|nr:hypothetical protein [Bifidobacterium eulemuris]OZG65987.1 hypothetical protein BEUL_1885 [Bifidobacterium eulemuris]QOL32045.1 hypothetical protein BE0216_05880 [Bifidobacterium eulemuris]